MDGAGHAHLSSAAVWGRRVGVGGVREAWWQRVPAPPCDHARNPAPRCAPPPRACSESGMMISCSSSSRAVRKSNVAVAQLETRTLGGIWSTTT